MVRENDIYQHFSQEGLKDPRHKKTYTKIFETLAKPPDETLGPDFPKQVIRRIEAMERKRRRWYFTGIFSGVLVMLGAFLAAMVYGVGWEAMSGYKNYLYWTALVGISFLIIHYLDPVISRRRNISQLT